MSSSNSLSRPIFALASRSLRPARRPVAPVALGAFSRLPTPAAARGYATDKPQTQAERMAELQAKQLKLAEKAGRMKQNIGVVSSRCLDGGAQKARS